MTAASLRIQQPYPPLTQLLTACMLRIQERLPWVLPKVLTFSTGLYKRKILFKSLQCHLCQINAIKNNPGMRGLPITTWFMQELVATKCSSKGYFRDELQKKKASGKLFNLIGFTNTGSHLFGSSVFSGCSNPKLGQNSNKLFTILFFPRCELTALGQPARLGGSYRWRHAGHLRGGVYQINVISSMHHSKIPLLTCIAGLLLPS